MKTRLPLFLFLMVSGLFISCGAFTGEEVGRLSINKVSTSEENATIKETSLDLKKGDELGLWSEMDMEYEGAVELRFRIEVIKDGETIDNLEIDPTDKSISIMQSKTVWNNKTDWSYTGKNGEYTIKEDGNYTFRGFLVASENPSLVIEEAEFVLKM